MKKQKQKTVTIKVSADVGVLVEFLLDRVRRHGIEGWPLPWRAYIGGDRLTKGGMVDVAVRGMRHAFDKVQHAQAAKE